MGAPTLDEAIDEYLSWARRHRFKEGSGTPRTYRQKLTQFASVLGGHRRIDKITGDAWYAACNRLWDDSSAETYNSGRNAARALLAYCRKAGHSKVHPPELWDPRPVSAKRSQTLPRKTVNGLFDPDKYPLRERALWTMLYETSERIEAILSLDVPDMDWDNCTAYVRIKGGDTRPVSWPEDTCELLGEYVGDRTWGPLFLTDGPAWNWRDRDQKDIGPDRRCRLSAHRARIIYREMTGLARPHRLRHSRLTHLSTEPGANSAMLKAISGHVTDKMLARYAQPSPEEVVKFMTEIKRRGAS